MLWNDLREYLDKLDELGMLTTVRDAHWDEEIGVISELMIERGGPALVFDNIPGYPQGFRVTTNLCLTPVHMALALGLDYGAAAGPDGGGVGPVDEGLRARSTARGSRRPHFRECVDG